MRNKIIGVLWAALVLAAPALEAGTPEKKTTVARKIIQKNTGTLPRSKIAKKTTSTANVSVKAQSAKIRSVRARVLKTRSAKTRVIAKTRKKVFAQKKSTPSIVAAHSSRKIAKRNTLTLASNKAPTLTQRKAIVAKAIADARSQVKIERVSAPASTLYAPHVQSASVLVVNPHSGQVFYEKNARRVAPIASITKVMTAIVTLDAHLAMNELLTVTEADIDRVKKTSSRLSVGTKLTRAEMLLLALMSSENRAASALSRHYPGGQAEFIAAMNKKAHQLGMTHTQFYDPTGLSKRNVSTPHDLSLMLTAAHLYPDIQQFSTSIEYSFHSNLTGKQLVFRNTNPLTRNDNWDIGVSKTGYTSEAGKCLAMHAIVNNTPVVIVLLDSVGGQTRVADAQRIKRWMESERTA